MDWYDEARLGKQLGNDPIERATEKPALQPSAEYIYACLAVCVGFFGDFYHWMGGSSNVNRPGVWDF